MGHTPLGTSVKRHDDVCSDDFQELLPLRFCRRAFIFKPFSARAIIILSRYFYGTTPPLFFGLRDETVES